jgi:hypothetical protein
LSLYVTFREIRIAAYPMVDQVGDVVAIKTFVIAEPGKTR